MLYLRKIKLLNILRIITKDMVDFGVEDIVGFRVKDILIFKLKT